jgi:hypothetical protein
MTQPVIGIDVGKQQLTVSLATDKKVWSWANDEPGRAE